MNNMRELGRQTGEAVRLIRFIPTTDNFKALIRFAAIFFEEYTHEPQRDRQRGQVVKMPGDNVSKYLMENDGRIQETPRIENNEVQPRILKLFRNSSRFPWVSGEFCERGFERYWENPNRPEENGWYRVIIDLVDDSTPPPNAPQRWEKL